MASKGTNANKKRLNKIYTQIRAWIDEGRRGVTSLLLVKAFKLPPQSAQILLECYYERFKDTGICPGWMAVQKNAEPPTNAPYDFVETVGQIYSNADLKSAEQDGTEFESKQLYSIHAPNLDSTELIKWFDLMHKRDLRSAEDLARGKTVDPKNNALTKLVQESKEKLKMDKLFKQAGDREKVRSPKGKKVITPERPAEDFFKPSPSKKKAENEAQTSPPKRAARNLNADMSDVFTTGHDEEDDSHMEVDVPSREEPSKKTKTNKSKSSLPPKQKQQKLTVESAAAGDSSNKAEEENKPVISHPPGNAKTLQAVDETFVDDEGFLVTSRKKKMVEEVGASSGKNQPPPPKKRAVAAPAASKAKPKTAQASITSFFKKN